jgi:hypothetical protein
VERQNTPQVKLSSVKVIREEATHSDRQPAVLESSNQFSLFGPNEVPCALLSRKIKRMMRSPFFVSAILLWAAF